MCKKRQEIRLCYLFSRLDGLPDSVTWRLVEYPLSRGQSTTVMYFERQFRWAPLAGQSAEKDGLAGGETGYGKGDDRLF